MSVAKGKVDKPKQNLNKVGKQNIKKGVKVLQNLNSAKKFDNKSNKMTAENDSKNQSKLQTGQGDNASLNKRQKQRQKTKQKKDMLKEKLSNINAGEMKNVVNVDSINKKLQAIESKEAPLTGTGKRRVRELKKLKRLAEGKPAVINQSNDANPKAALSKAAQRRQRRGHTAGKGISDQKLQNDIWENDTKKCEKRLQEINSKQNIKTPKAAASSEELDDSESDYEVEHMVKADKITKKLSAQDGTDSDEDSVNDNADSMLMESDGADDDDDDADDADNTMSMDEAESDEDSNESTEETEMPQKKKLNLINKVVGKAVVKTAGKTSEADKINKLLSNKVTRYVVFVGNLPYSVDKSTLQEHFSKAGEVKEVRIATERGTNKPRGFAYVELFDSESYEKALSLNHTMVGGRRVNVQYTQPGHKKSTEKKKQVKAKNLKLNAMRKQGMLSGSAKPGQNRTARRNKAKGKNSEKSA